MSSKRMRGVLFKVYPDDHKPMRAHAVFGASRVVVEFAAIGTVRLSRHEVKRDLRVQDVRHILRTAKEHVETLLDMWRDMHR